MNIAAIYKTFLFALDALNNMITKIGKKWNSLNPRMKVLSDPLISSSLIH